MFERLLFPQKDPASRRMSPRRPYPVHRSERAQVIILVVISFVALLAFVGLVTDVGSIYVTYTQLKRAVDAAAVAAANNIKSAALTDAQRRVNITEAAREMLSLHQVTNIALLEVYLCGDSGSPADFVALCPGTGEPPRKLAWVQATQNVPVYFLGIVGVQSIPLTLSSVGEAATLDLVLVFDTSESMGLENMGGQSQDDFDPTSCNASNTCQPLRQAKDAAKELLRNLFNNYDQVGIITFDFQARQIPIYDPAFAGNVAMSTNIGDDDGVDDGDAFAAIDFHVQLHNDPPAGRVPWYAHRFNFPNSSNRLNFINPEDRDGDGSDVDGGSYSCTDIRRWVDDYNFRAAAEDPNGGPDLYDDDSQIDVSGNKTSDETWVFCDNDYLLDVFDWNLNGFYDDDGAYNPPYTGLEERALASTCTGCGIRMATDTLLINGRPNGVWVMVLLSDGAANMSDTPQSWANIPNAFPYGFCGSNPSIAFWVDKCFDYNGSPSGSAGRYCIDANASECPFGTVHTAASRPYSSEDYAYDMVDRAGLMFSDNPDEPAGADIVMYSIGLGNGVTLGEPLLRYMANVGSDGDRVTDPCNGVATRHNCGNYYFAPNASYLAQIFETIAGNIFTKISR